MRAFWANLLWFASCLPGLFRFVVACARPRAAQLRVLRESLRAVEADTGLRDPLATIGSLEPAGYDRWQARLEAFARGTGPSLTREAPTLLHPTSGSTGGVKLIPYTRVFARQVRRAIGAWIGGLYCMRPGLLFGTQYWSISPNTRTAWPGARVPVGFADDTEYLGGFQRRAVARLLAVPAAVSRIVDPAAFRHVTLLFLLRARNLRLVSVWHPSFFTLLLSQDGPDISGICDELERGLLRQELRLPPDVRAELQRHLSPDPRRARELRATDFRAPDGFARAWPRLEVISCWTDGCAEPWLGELRRMFPMAEIQPKGLLATEGWVTVPIGLGGRCPCAVTAHFLEFVESGSGAIRRVWELVRGREYSVVLSAGTGLLRYRLGDRVRVEGAFLRTPCLRFLGREGETSDRFGEKLDGGQIRAMLAEIDAKYPARVRFALVAPCEERGRWFYSLFIEAEDNPQGGWRVMGEAAENFLRRNCHYDHARQLGQLGPLAVFRMRGSGVEQYRAHLERQGMKAGDIKVESLSPRADWPSAFDGQWVLEPHG